MGNEYVKAVIPAKGHTFGKWSVTKKSTCGDTGLENRSCQDCGMVETKVIPKKTTHNFGPFTKVKDPTCSSKGERTRICSDCGLVQIEEIPTTEHQFGEWEIAVKPNCETEGKRVRYCINCNNAVEKTIPKTDHEYGKWNVLRQPTCSQEGIRVRYCKTCLNEEKKAIVKTDHDFGDWENTRTPTCEREGEKKRNCKICNDEETKMIPKTEHQLGNYIVTKTATCTEDGEEKRYCNICDFVETNVIKSSGHKFGIDTVVKPTVSNIGYTLYVCSNCGKNEKDNFVPKLIKISSSDVYGLSQSYSYTGNALKPKFTVIVKGKTLKSGQDYDAVYKNNINIGKATIAIKCKGSYAGTVSKTFSICPAKESITGLSTIKNSIKVKYKTQKNVSGYQINICSKPSFKGGLIYTVNKNTTAKIITNLGKSKKYYIRVRSFKNVNNVKYYGGWSVIKGIYTR